MLTIPLRWRKPERIVFYPPIKSETTLRVLAFFEDRPDQEISMGELTAAIGAPIGRMRAAVTTLIGRRKVERAGMRGAFILYRLAK